MRSVVSEACRVSFEELVERYAGPLRGLLLSAGVPDAHADELLQDVMLRVWSRAEQFDGERASFRTWIYAIARNTRVDWYRGRRPNTTSAVELDTLPDGRSTHSKKIDYRTILDRATRALPEDQAEVFRLVHQEGWSLPDVATHLEIPLGTVKSRLRLAMDRIRGIFNTP